MTYNFGDSFDLYAAVADMAPTYRDSATNPANSSLLAGRFPNSRCLSVFGISAFVKSSGANDPVHHIVASVLSTVAVSGTSLGLAFTLFDGTTAQCTVLFRSDGAILLTSGTSAGAVLATYPSGVTAQNVWFGFEFEIKIDSSAGSFTVRKNGNSVADFTATGLNTRVSANNYANKLQLGAGGSTFSEVDDFFWQSGAATGNWLGELRCLTRMPASDQSVQFSRSSPAPVSLTNTNTTTVRTAGSTFYLPFTPTFSGTVAAATILANVAATAHVKLAIYSSASNFPATVLGTSSEITNPVAGSNAVTFSPAVSLIKGTLYFIGVDQDASVTYSCWSGGTSNCYTGTTAYASFPAANPTGLTGNGGILGCTLTIVPSVSCDLVGEAQQDSAATYVFDNNPGDQDLYGIGIANTATPFSTVAVIARGYMQKSDAGTRTAAMQVKSGRTTVATPTLVLTNTGWQWTSRLDIADPNTSAAWANAAVDALQIGPKVVA